MLFCLRLHQTGRNTYPRWQPRTTLFNENSGNVNEVTAKQYPKIGFGICILFFDFGGF
ncbi:Uncharacterized protein APZ42_009025 [Daphnia magna]|uniref:Uncharacterized protein n=1 Tax=Daphnia magna TaxID=35525 RepID=A0A164E9E6_9CRUS|nr:Uncharacterized protein APZ42_009025 [Daphnia magna]